MKYLEPEIEIIGLDEGILTDISFTSGDVDQDSGTDIPIIIP